MKSFSEKLIRPLKCVGFIGLGIVIGKIHSMNAVKSTLESCDTSYSPTIQKEIDKEQSEIFTDVKSILMKRKNWGLVESHLKNYLLPRLQLKNNSVFVKFGVGTGFVFNPTSFQEYVEQSDIFFGNVGLSKEIIHEYQKLAHSLMITNSIIMTRWVYEESKVKMLHTFPLPDELQAYEIALKEYMKYWRETNKRLN